MKADKIQDGSYFAVIDTETTWSNAVMSIGVAIAESSTFKLVDKKYYIISPEYKDGGMYSYVLMTKSAKLDLNGSRQKVIEHLVKVLLNYHIDSIFAYNASFDYNHLPELHNYKWFDIMKIAAYKQYNPRIPKNAECCGTGRLKRDYGVEPITRLLSGNRSYFEVHNAVCDAVDELRIMELLGYALEDYGHAQINPEKKPSTIRPREQRVVPKLPKPTKPVPEESEDIIEKRLIANCKFAIGDKIRHTLYGCGVVRKVEVMNEEIMLLTVLYEAIGISLHLLPADEKDITLIND